MYDHPFLQFVSAYVRISEDEVPAIIDLVHHAYYAKGELILSKGSIPRNLFFILQGAVRIFYIDESGVEQTVNFIFENQPLVGFDSFASQTPSGVSAMALEPTKLIWTSHAEFFGFLEQHPRFETAVRSVMGHYLRLNTEHTKLLRINPARDRYEALGRTRPELLTRVPLKFLASYIGMTLETLSRVRAGKL